MTETVSELVGRLNAAREYSQDEKVALATLTHFILSPDCQDFTAGHAKHILNILARYEPPAREAATALASAEAQIAELTALVNKYAWERDKARDERDQAEGRSEKYWKARVMARSEPLK